MPERAADEGGLQQQRHPGLDEDHAAPVPPGADDWAGFGDEDANVGADMRALDLAAARRTVVRAHAMNEGEGRGDDLLPNF